MKNTLTTLSICLIALVSSDARPRDQRQENPEQAGGHRPPPPPLALFFLFDEDRNGILDEQEIEHAPAIMNTLDANQDGEVSIDEVLPPPPGEPQDGEEQRPRRGGRPHGPPPIIAALDTDRDGVISADELAAASEALAALDANGDGELTRDEFGHPGPPPHQGRPDDAEDEQDQ